MIEDVMLFYPDGNAIKFIGVKNVAIENGSLYFERYDLKEKKTVGVTTTLPYLKSRYKKD